MSYTEQAPSEQESLDIIHKMIHSAKRDLEDNSFHYLLWGWLVFLASTIQFVLIQMQNPHSYLGWMILMPVGGVISAIYGSRQGKKQRVKTYMDEVFKYILISFLVSLFFILAFMSKLGLMTYPLVMVVYGMWLFTSGAIIHFRPLIVGGILNWGLAIIAIFLPFEFQLMILAIAVMFGYIIPGYMLKNKFRTEQKQLSNV